jgi:hypothetical protein
VARDRQWFALEDSLARATHPAVWLSGWRQLIGLAPFSGVQPLKAFNGDRCLMPAQRHPKS